MSQMKLTQGCFKMRSFLQVVLCSARCVLSPLQADLYFVFLFLFDLFLSVKLMRFFFHLSHTERPLFFFVSSQSKTFEVSCLPGLNLWFRRAHQMF